MTNIVYLFSRLYKSEKTFLLIPLLSLGLGLSSSIQASVFSTDYIRTSIVKLNQTMRITFFNREKVIFYDASFIQKQIVDALPNANVKSILLTQGLLHIGDRASGIF